MPRLSSQLQLEKLQQTVLREDDAGDYDDCDDAVIVLFGQRLQDPTRLYQNWQPLNLTWLE